MSFSKIKKNIFYLILVQLANYVAPLIILPYLARTVGIDGVGIIVICLSICGISFIITDFGFAISSTYWISINRDNKDKISRHMGATFIIKTILSVIIVCFLYFYIEFSNVIDNKSILLPLLLTIILQSYQIPWFFQGIEKMKNITYCTVITKMSYLLLVIIFVHTPEDINIVIICFMISNFLSTLLGFILYYNSGYYLNRPNIRVIFSIFKNNIPFFFSRAAVGIYTSASTLIIGNYAGTSQAALYSSAEKLYQGAISLTSPISPALYPYMAKTKDRSILLRFIFLLLPIAILVSIICIVFSKEIIIFIYGNEFSNATNILKIFVIISTVSFISINFGYPIYSTINRLDIVNKSVIIGGCIQLILITSLYFADKISAINVTLSVLITEVIILLLRIIPFYLITRSSK